MNESTDDFKENIKFIKQKKQQSLLSKYFANNFQNKTKLNTKTSLISNQLDELSQSPLDDVKIKSKTISFANLNHSIDICDKDKSFNDLIKSEEYTCPLCHINLSGFIEHDREKHVNKCLDNSINDKILTKTSSFFENDKPEAKNNVDTSNESKIGNKIIKYQNQLTLKDVIPNCPICGKILHSLNVISLINIFTINKF
jgi:hypothetical protein